MAAEPRDARDPQHTTFTYATSRVILRSLLRMFFRFQVHRVDRVPLQGPVLLASNHQSYLDPPIIGVPLMRPMAYLAKKELFDNPIFAGYIRRLNAFPVDQNKGDIGAMRQSLDILKAGWALAVFPEGSRTFDGELQPAQKGMGLMIKRAKATVVPAVLDGSFDAWPRSSTFPRPRPVSVLYGEPTDLSHLSVDDVRKWTDDTLGRMLDDLRSGRV
jgi:1-acyl-sn-glycerol-3-phosphate acyltransferase